MSDYTREELEQMLVEKDEQELSASLVPTADEIKINEIVGDIDCTQYNLKCMITSLAEDVPGRKTKVHSDFRAVDFHSESWGDFHIARFQHEFRKVFKGKGAFNSKGEDRPIVYHKVEGGVSHFHMQVRRRNSNRTIV